MNPAITDCRFLSTRKRDGMDRLRLTLHSRLGIVLKKRFATLL